MDIIVTTPKSQMKAAAQEAANCIADGGGEYFRRFEKSWWMNVASGDRIYYVEDGYIRGFCVISRLVFREYPETCQTTGRVWSAGRYFYMDAKTWQWNEPIPLRGFQGFQYADVSGAADGKTWITLSGQDHPLKIVGGWLDPKPEVKE